MRQYVCIDIGGTAIKYGCANEAGRLVDTGSMPSGTAQGAEEIIHKVTGIVQTFQVEYDIVGIAISTAGIVHSQTGTILYAGVHFPGYTGLRLAQIIEETCGLPCTVENDVNAAGLGEYWLGAGRGASSLCCLTVGTGIGGCLIADGKLWHGISSSAGEIGYMLTGGTGTLEEQASVTALLHVIAERKGMAVESIDGKRVFQWIRDGDEIAIEGMDCLIHRLAIGIANVCYVFNPELIVVGGGIMAQADYICPRLTAALREVLLPYVFQRTRVAAAALGNHAGLLGALYYFMQTRSGHLGTAYIH